MGARRPRPRPRIFQVADEFRAAVLRREERAARELLRVYGQAQRRSEAMLGELRRVLPEEGKTWDWLMAQERLRALERQIAAEMAHLRRITGEVTVGEQRVMAALAQDHAEALVRAAPGSASLTMVWSRLPASVVEQMVGQLQPGSPLHDLLARLGHDTAQRAARELALGIALGRNPRVVAELMVDAQRLAYPRALRIARTEMLRAYRETTRQSLLANRDVVVGWIWHSALGPRTCPACVAMHGSVHELDETLDDHPNGRCGMVPLTRPWAELGAEAPETRAYVTPGPELFAALSPARQEAILGPAFEAYRDGRVTLEQFVGRRYSPQWGSMRYARSLRSVLAGGG